MRQETHQSCARETTNHITGVVCARYKIGVIVAVPLLATPPDMHRSSRVYDYASARHKHRDKSTLEFN